MSPVDNGEHHAYSKVCIHAWPWYFFGNVGWRASAGLDSFAYFSHQGEKLDIKDWILSQAENDVASRASMKKKRSLNELEMTKGKEDKRLLNL
jgi:hypothetical protein